MGVSEGHTAILRLVGVGYRATVEERPKKAQYPGQKFVCLKLGFTHAVEEPVPFGLKASTPQPTRILLEGIDREQVMTFAAQIRKWRRPEPYKVRVSSLMTRPSSLSKGRSNDQCACHVCIWSGVIREELLRFCLLSVLYTIAYVYPS